MEGAGASIGTKTSRHEKPVEKEEQRRGKQEGEPAQHGESPSTRMAKDVVNARQSGETPGTPAVSGRVCKCGGWVVKKGGATAGIVTTSPASSNSNTRCLWKRAKQPKQQANMISAGESPGFSPNECDLLHILVLNSVPRHHMPLIQSLEEVLWETCFSEGAA